jgi:hypothetical protein
MHPLCDQLEIKYEGRKIRARTWREIRTYMEIIMSNSLLRVITKPFSHPQQENTT